MDRRLFERTVELAKSTKGSDFKKLPKSVRLAVDSRPLAGAGRVEETFNLGHASRQLLAFVEKPWRGHPQGFFEERHFKTHLGRVTISCPAGNTEKSKLGTTVSFPAESAPPVAGAPCVPTPRTAVPSRSRPMNDCRRSSGSRLPILRGDKVFASASRSNTDSRITAGSKERRRDTWAFARTSSMPDAMLPPSTSKPSTSQTRRDYNRLKPFGALGGTRIGGCALCGLRSASENDAWKRNAVGGQLPRHHARQRRDDEVPRHGMASAPA